MVAEYYTEKKQCYCQIYFFPKITKFTTFFVLFLEIMMFTGRRRISTSLDCKIVAKRHCNIIWDCKVEKEDKND